MSIRIYLHLIIVLLILIDPVSAFKVLESGEHMDPNTVIEDDLYVCEDTVIIKGVVLGDVLACGGLVEISGNVTGDVMVGAGSVIINGFVGDDVRVGAGTLIVNGVVGDDLVAGVGTMIIADNAEIGGDVVAGSGQMELKGNIGGNITGGAGVVTLSGNVGGDVELDVGELNVLPGASINGNLTYTGPNKAAIPAGVVGKDVLFTERPKPEDERFGASSIIWWFIRYLFLLVIGLLVLAVFPNRAAAIAQSIPENPLKNIAIGFLLAVAGFLGSILLFITVIGIPLGLILLFMTFFVLYTARLFFGLWLGRIIFSRLGRESKPWMDMVVGLFVLFILTSLPWIGFLIYLLLAAVRERYGIPAPYVINVGTLQPRKNLTGLLDAFAGLLGQGRDLHLAIAGKKGWLYEPLFARVRELGLEQRVHFAGYVPPSDLPALLSGARLFVLPSLYEGFGLPVLEAMACGTPVVCSAVASLPEVAGDAAILVDPHDTAQLAQGMARVLDDPDLSRQLVRRGLERVTRFSWEQCARQTLQVLEAAGAA